MQAQFYMAIVAIGPDYSPLGAIDILNSILDGCELSEAEAGRFEGVTVFTNENSILIVELFAMPVDEVCGHHVLEIHSAREIDPSSLGKVMASGFLENFPTGGVPRGNGYVDISHYVASFISSKSSLKSWAIDGVW
jgi:hypothetical protein